MSEWNYTKCAKPFATAQDARDYLASRDLAGFILKRTNGYAAVCPTYPDGFYPDAIEVDSVDNSLGELKAQLQASSHSCCD